MNMGWVWSFVSAAIFVAIFPALAWREWGRARKSRASDPGASTRLNVVRFAGVMFVAAFLLNVLTAARYDDMSALWILPAGGVSAVLGFAGIAATQQALDASRVAHLPRLDRRNYWATVAPLAVVAGLGTGIASHYAADSTLTGTVLQALGVGAATVVFSTALEGALLRRR